MKNNPETTGGKVLLRTQNGSSGPYRAFNVVFALVLAAVVVLALVQNGGVGAELRWYGLLGALAAGGLLFWLLHFLLLRVDIGKPWPEPLLAGLFFAALVVLQALVGWQLRASPGSGWQYGTVYQYALDNVVNGTQNPEFFAQFPGELGVYSFLCLYFGAFRQMGLSDLTVPILVLNIVCVDLSVLIMYRAARMLMNPQKALFVLLCAVLCAGFWLYTPYLSGITLVMPFVVGAAQLWLQARRRWRTGDVSGTMTKFLLLSFFTALGALLNPIVLILYIAILLDLMFMLVGSARWLVLLAGLALCAAVLFAGTWLLRNALFDTPLRPDAAAPGTYWVLMGLSDSGTVNAADTALVLGGEAAGKAARSSLIANEITSRLADLGAGGVFGKLAQKLGFAFGDGTYYAAQRLYEDAVNHGAPLAALLLPGGAGFMAFAYIAFGVQGALLLGVLLGAVRSILRKNDALTFLRVAVFGLVLFQSVWAAGPWYLVPFLPLLLLVAMEALPLRRAALVKQPVRVPRKTGETGPLTGSLVAPADTASSTFSPAKTEERLHKSGTLENAGDLFAEEAQDPGQPGNLFDQPATRVDGNLQTQVFDVPTGDPFYELARTASWEVSDLSAEMVGGEPGPEGTAPAAEETAAEAAPTTPMTEEPSGPTGPDGGQAAPAEATQTAEPQVEIFAAMEEEAALDGRPMGALTTELLENPRAVVPSPNLHDAFTRAAVNAFQQPAQAGEAAAAEEEPPLPDEAKAPAPLPPAGRTPAELADTDDAPGQEYDLFKALRMTPPAGIAGEGQAEEKQLESLWDFEDQE